MTPAKFELLNNRQLETVTERKDAGLPAPIFATPYIWKDASRLPLREWVYGRLLIRKFVTATVAPGGVGKSSLGAVESLAQVSGKNLLGVFPSRQLRVSVESRRPSGRNRTKNSGRGDALSADPGGYWRSAICR
jgi:hypothetical protein